MCGSCALSSLAEAVLVCHLYLVCHFNHISQMRCSFIYVYNFINYQRKKQSTGNGRQLIQISKVVRVSGDRGRAGAMHSRISPSHSGQQDWKKRSSPTREGSGHPWQPHFRAVSLLPSRKETWMNCYLRTIWRCRCKNASTAHLPFLFSFSFPL